MKKTFRLVLFCLSLVLGLSLQVFDPAPAHANPLQSAKDVAKSIEILINQNGVWTLGQVTNAPKPGFCVSLANITYTVGGTVYEYVNVPVTFRAGVFIDGALRGQVAPCNTFDYNSGIGTVTKQGLNVNGRWHFAISGIHYKPFDLRMLPFASSHFKCIMLVVGC
jgi:hypothetical protein